MAEEPQRSRIELQGDVDSLRSENEALRFEIDSLRLQNTTLAFGAGLFALLFT